MNNDQKAKFVAFAFTGADLLLEVMPDDGLIGFNAGLSKKITGFSQESLKNKSLYDFLIESERALLKRHIQKLGPSGRLSPALYHIHNKELTKPVLIGICRLPDYAPAFVTITGVEGFLGDNEEIRRHDLETGLFGPKEFQEKIQVYIDNNRDVFDKSTITLVEVGSSLTHLPDDQAQFVLAQIGSYMRSNSLDGDMATRLDESRFSLVHDDRVDQKDVVEYMEDLIRLVDPQSKSISVQTKSISCENPGASAEEVSQAFLYCLNKFAEKGIASVSVATIGESLNEMMNATLKKVSSLNDVISTNTYKIVFQPIVDMRSGKTHHYEALSRFENHDSPYEMIAFAEEIGKIQELDLFVCHQVAEQLRSMASGNKRPLIAINLSAKSLGSTIFVRSLHQLLEPYQSLSKQIMFELTESATISDYKQMNDAIQGLRQKGHAFCLDDIGAGASSLLYIRNFEVDYAKIDGSYIRNIQNNPKNLAFVKTIVNLCHDIGIDVIAEMVETPEEKEILLGLGIGLGQGYLFGRPSSVMDNLSATMPTKARKIPSNF
ncbi:MAG: EAL domain-containing protein [bacterium]|jgi:EAL domain-containing protein (putative c-di-GMP-specific phosphodiesterase class I)